MLKQRNVLLVSLIAMFAVASARADIASKQYVDDEIDALAEVATTGSYTDLSNKPDIQGIESDLDAVWDTDNDNSLVNRVSSVEKALGETGKTDAGKAIIAGNSLGTPTYRAIDTTAGGTNGSDSLITSDAVFDGLAGKQATINDLSDIRNNATAGASASATIATYGNIVTHNTSEFASSGQGAKADSAIQSVKVNGSALTPDSNKAVDVTVPTKVSDLTNDAGYITSADIAGGQVQADWTETDDNDPAYIKHKPTKVSDFTNDTGFVTASDQVQPNWNATSGKGQILNKPTLATVATSGSYTDLSNTPTAVSDFTNDAGYLTSHQTLPTVTTSTGSGNVVTNVTQTNGAIAVTKGRVQIPVGNETADTYASIWVE